MSASNWAFCPRCDRDRTAEKAARWAEIEAMYGVAPVAEFDAARSEFHETYADGQREGEETFREDYGIWGAREGTIRVRYRGACEACGLSLSFEHEHEFFPTKEAV